MHQIIHGNTETVVPKNANHDFVARKMSTLKLRDLINDARADAGEPRVRNDQFLARVEDELGDELEGVQKYYTPFHGNQVAQSRAKVIDRWLATRPHRAPPAAMLPKNTRM